MGQGAGSARRESAGVGALDGIMDTWGWAAEPLGPRRGRRAGLIPGGGTLDSQRLAGGRRLLPESRPGRERQRRALPPPEAAVLLVLVRRRRCSVSIPGLNLEVRLDAPGPSTLQVRGAL